MSRLRHSMLSTFVLRYFEVSCLICCVLLITTLSGDVRAVQADPGQPLDAAAEPERSPRLLAERAGLLAELETYTVRFQSLEEGLEALSGEEYLIRLGQIGRLELETVALFDRMADNLIASREAGLDTADLDQAIEINFAPSTDYMIRLIAETELALDDLAATKGETVPRDLLDYEQRFAEDSERIDNYFQLLLDHGVRLRRVGLDDQQVTSEISSRLPERADQLVGRIELARNQSRALRQRIADGSNDSDTAFELQAAELKLEWATRSLTSASRILDELGLPTANYRQILIQTTGLTEDIFDREVATGLLGDLTSTALVWVQQNGITIAFQALLFVLIVFVARLIGNFVGDVLKRGIRATSMRSSQALQNMLATVVSRAILLLGLLFGISQIGIEIAPVLAAIGIIGFAVGFALQETLSNFAAGTMLMVYRPFDNGDVVKTGGLVGTVDDISLVNTTLLTFDNQRVLVPNNQIWGNVITNVSAMDIRRIDISLPLSSHEPIQPVFAALEELVREDARVLPEPPPNIRVNGFSEGSVEVIVRPWVRREDFWETFWDLSGRIKIRLEEAGVELASTRQRILLEEVAPG